MDDQTDVTTPTQSGGLFASLDDLASSAISSIGGAVTSRVSGAINATAGTASAPAPDVTAKAATPGGTSVINMAAISLPVLLMGGAVLALLVLKR